jgi:hypothetical protein
MILFSVFKGIDEVLDVKNTVAVTRYFKNLNIEFRLVAGSYEGTEEISFQVDDDQIDNVLWLAALFSQDSILVIDKTGSSTLLYTSNEDLAQADLGRFTEISSTSGVDAFTVIGGAIFTCGGAK